MTGYDDLWEYVDTALLALDRWATRQSPQVKEQAQTHPGWCYRPDCRAYGYPDAEPYHRSEPTVLTVTADEQIAVWLIEAAGRPSVTRVELVAAPAPFPDRPWRLEHPYAEMVLTLDAAQVLGVVLRRLVRTATP